VLDPSLRSSRSTQDDPVTPGRREVASASSAQSQRSGDHLATLRRSETASGSESDSDTETATPKSSKRQKEQNDKVDHGVVEGAMRGNTQWSKSMISRCSNGFPTTGCRPRTVEGIARTGTNLNDCGRAICAEHEEHRETGTGHSGWLEGLIANVLTRAGSYVSRNQLLAVHCRTAPQRGQPIHTLHIRATQKGCERRCSAADQSI
jgi:hypothetical protein